MTKERTGPNCASIGVAQDAFAGREAQPGVLPPGPAPDRRGLVRRQVVMMTNSRYPSGRVLAGVTMTPISPSLIRRGRPPAHRGSSAARPLALNVGITSRTVPSSVPLERLRYDARRTRSVRHPTWGEWTGARRYLGLALRRALAVQTRWRRPSRPPREPASRPRLRRGRRVRVRTARSPRHRLCPGLRTAPDR